MRLNKRSYDCRDSRCLLLSLLLLVSCTNAAPTVSQTSRSLDSEGDESGPEGLSMFLSLIRAPHFLDDSLVGGLDHERQLLKFVQQRRDMTTRQSGTDLVALHYTCVLLGSSHVVSSYGTLPDTTPGMRNPPSTYAMVLPAQMSMSGGRAVLMELAVLDQHTAADNVFDLYFDEDEAAWKIFSSLIDARKLKVPDSSLYGREPIPEVTPEEKDPNDPEKLVPCPAPGDDDDDEEDDWWD